MTPKERAAQVVTAYGYPELTQLQNLVEQAIIAAVEEERERCAKKLERFASEAGSDEIRAIWLLTAAVVRDKVQS